MLEVIAALRASLAVAKVATEIMQAAQSEGRQPTEAEMRRLEATRRQVEADWASLAPKGGA